MIGTQKTSSTAVGIFNLPVVIRAGRIHARAHGKADESRSQILTRSEADGISDTVSSADGQNGTTVNPSDGDSESDVGSLSKADPILNRQGR